MKMPFVLRSTYDALTERFEKAVAFRQEMERRADSSYTEAKNCASALSQRDETIKTLRGYVAARDDVIGSLEASTAGMRIAFESDSRAIVNMAERIAKLELQLAAATPKPPAKPRRSKLTEAIREQATLPDGTIDPRLLNHFRARANSLRRQGKKEGEIIEAIGIWQVTGKGESEMTVDAIVSSFDVDTVP